MDYHKRIQAICAHCGAPFQVVPGEIRRGYGKFCSRACSYKARASVVCITPPSEPVERVRANGLVNMRVRRGAMERPKHCAQCGKACRPDAHHDDYSKPDEVVWLCRSCHMKRHWMANAVSTAN